MMNAESKNGVIRAKFTVIRNPALLPAKRISQQPIEEHTVRMKANKLTANAEKLLPKEQHGYIKCRKHDFL